MNDEQIRVLDRLTYGIVPTQTDWDEDEKIKQAFLSLEESRHIERVTRRWYITKKGREVSTNRRK